MQKIFDHFTEETLRKDLVNYLIDFSEDETVLFVPKSKNGIFTVFLFEDTSIELTGKEEITITRFEYDNQVFSGRYYYITIAIGKYVEPNKYGVDEVEIGYAKLKYNEDYSLYDVTFWLDEFQQFV